LVSSEGGGWRFVGTLVRVDAEGVCKLFGLWLHFGLVVGTVFGCRARSRSRFAVVFGSG
jgi:hypothetical protein